MKNILVLVLLVVSVGCMRGPRGHQGDSRVSAGPVGPGGSDGADSTVPGPVGPSGSDGDDAINVVSANRALLATECVGVGGTAVDFYADLDASANVSAGDAYQSSLVSCNGNAGSNGSDGSDATLNSVKYDLAGAAVCYAIPNTSYSFKKVNATSNEVKVWANATCANTAIANLSLTQSNGTYLIPASTTFLFVSGTHTLGMRALTVTL